MRKLVKILLSLLLVSPAAALALGVGDVQLHSALNQRLDAEIKLLSVDPAEADTIEVSLASYEDFAKVGLERPSSLMFLRFDVEQSPSGEYYIKISSREAIREPFLDFLVEVKWRSGRVLREYTLLLDPPVRHQEAAPVVTTPVTAPSAAPAPAMQAAQAEEDEFEPPPSSIPVAPGYEAPAATAERAPAPAATPERAPAPVAAAPSKSIVYGPVKSGDTLWKIAQKLRPNRNITDLQMMMALLIANPYAFIDNNINRLKKGYVLRIDDLSVLTAMSKAEAAREVSRQTRAWQDYRASIAAKAATRKPAAVAKKAPGAAVGTAKKEPKLELVTPDGKAEQPGKATDGASKVQKELMLALESSAAQRKENEELQKRVEGLEKQLQDMQRLLTLRDADLAALQNQLSEQGKALSLPSKQEPAGEAEPVKPKAATEAGATEAKQKLPAPAKPDAASKQDVSPAKPQPENATQNQGAVPSKEKPAGAAPAEKTSQANKPANKPPVVIPPTEEPGIVDTVFGMVDDLLNNTDISLGALSLDDPIVMGGGAGLLILLLLLVMVRRRRCSGGFQESILTGGTSSMLGSQDDDENSETSFLSDLAISGMGDKSTIHTDEGEVDPLTEADVFMAYGRHQQAEEVLQKALEKHPDRTDLSAKLLEVYYNLKDADKFVALADKSAQGLKAEGEWDRVSKMGNELSPGNALFAVAAAGAAAAVAHADSAGQESMAGDVLDIGLDLDELTSDSGGDAGFDLGIDLGDLDEGEAEPAPVATAAEQPTDSDFEFDLDLGSDTVEDNSSEESSGLDFDLGGMEETEAPAAESADEFELDLGSDDTGTEADELSFGFEDVSGSESEAETSDEEASLDLGELDNLDFGDLSLEESSVEDESAAEESFDLDMSELESTGDDLGGLGDVGDLDDEGMFSDGDEATTKLDLAQAYIEMGDSEGARSMLEEVAESGSDEQKQQAQELLAKI